jgi:hypothetical protein
MEWWNHERPGAAAAATKRQPHEKGADERTETATDRTRKNGMTKLILQEQTEGTEVNPGSLFHQLSPVEVL